MPPLPGWPRLLVYKLAAVLHDPAWKPWVVSSAFQDTRGRSVGRVFASIEGESPPAAEGRCDSLVKSINRGLKAHEQDAAAAALAALEPLDSGLASTVSDEILRGDGVVAEADRLAASLDRWVLTYLEKKLRKTSVKASHARYVNPLEPRLSYKPKAPSVDNVCRFVQGLRETVSLLRGAPAPLVYNTLLFVLEPLWYQSCRGCVPLADTRTPTHSVFDHVYATASMVNWLLEEGSKPSGFMVKLDVAGIQAFISAARKTRDLWAGSWLVSALAWYTVAEAVMLLGADVVLSPYPLANHFFIATLLKEIERLESNTGTRKQLEDLRKKLAELAEEGFLWRGSANQPIVPGTFFLALPCLDEEEAERLRKAAKQLKTVDKEGAENLISALTECSPEKLREYFLERFRRGWRLLAESTLTAYTSLESRESPCTVLEDLASRLERAGALDGWSQGEAKELLSAAVEEPPLRLRAVVVDVAEAYSELKGRVLKAIQETLEEGGGLLDREALEEARRETGASPEALAEEFARKLLFHYLFAEAVPRAEREQAEALLAVEPGYAVAKTLEKLTKSAFSDEERKAPGFHECSVCGRLPSIIHVGEESLDALAEELGAPRTLFTAGERLCPYCLIRRLMTLDKALLPVMDALGLHTATNGRIYPRVPSTPELASMSQLLRLIDMAAGDPELRSTLIEAGKGAGPGPEPPAALEAYARARLGSDAEKALRGIYRLNAEKDLDNLIASGAARDQRRCEALELPRGLCRALSSLKPQRYYAIVKGDGDWFGKCLVCGILDYQGPEEYIEEVLGSGVLDENARKALAQPYKRYARLLAGLAATVTGIDRAPTVPVTPSYYAALSRGQMITALYDAVIVEVLGGFPVYAGGDDVAALMPGSLGARKLAELADAVANAQPPPLKQLAQVAAEAAKRLGTGSPAAAAVILTRRNYWGMLRAAARGFHVTPLGGVYPAPAAYGRSYGVYIAHYHDPLQAAWSSAAELEELKDTLAAWAPRRGKGDACSHLASKKDMTFLSYGRVAGPQAAAQAALAALPNTEPCAEKTRILRGGGEEPARALEAAARLVSLVEEKAVSRSLIYDLERETGLAEKLVERLLGCDPWAEEATRKLAEMIARRNTQQNQAAEAASLLLACGAAAAGKQPPRRGSALPLPWHIARAARVILAAGR